VNGDNSKFDTESEAKPECQRVDLNVNKQDGMPCRSMSLKFITLNMRQHQVAPDVYIITSMSGTHIN